MTDSIKIDQRAIDFFTTPCNLANPESKDPLAEKIGFTVLAIFAIIALGIIIPLITCWAIKLHMQKNERELAPEETGSALSTPRTPVEQQDEETRSAHPSPRSVATSEEVDQISAASSPEPDAETTFERVGRSGCLITHVDRTYHEFFNYLLDQIIPTTGTICTFGAIIINPETNQVLRYNGDDSTLPQENEAFWTRCQQLTPLFMRYFSPILLKERLEAGDNRVVLHFTVVHNRTSLYNLHQDGVSSGNIPEDIDKGLPQNQRWITNPGVATLRDDALLFLTKAPVGGGRILPTAFIDVDPATPGDNLTSRANKKYFRRTEEGFGNLTPAMMEKQDHRIFLPEVGPDQAWGFKNNMTLHSTPHPAMVEHFYGEEALAEFYEDGLLNEKTTHTPFFRISASSFRVEDGAQAQAEGAGA